MYIYKFTHTETGRCYIGQTIQDLNQRRLEHIADSRHTPRTYHFHNALKKYGVDSFSFEVIAEATTLDELNLLEEKYIQEFDATDNGFNIRNGGGNKTHHPDSIKRMSEAQKASHARRREANSDRHEKHKKHIWTQPHPNKGGSKKEAFSKGTLTWKLENGIRVFYKKEASV
jgi:group I intron endonuclease